MYIQPECSLKDAIVAFIVHLLYVDIQLPVDDRCYLVYHSNVVNTGYMYGDNKIEFLVCVPCRCQNPVAMAAFQCIGSGAIALVNDNVFLLVIITQDIVSRYWVATVGNDVVILYIVICEAY